MPDKIVNHFVLADGSTAKYDAGALLNLDDTVSLAGYAPDAKAVGDRLTDLDNAIKDFSVIDGETQPLNLELVDGKYAYYSSDEGYTQYNGNIQTWATAQYAFLPVRPNQTYRITTSGSPNIPAVVYYSSAESPSHENYVGILEEVTGNKVYNDYEFTVPNGVYGIAVNTRNYNTYPITLVGFVATEHAENLMSAGYAKETYVDAISELVNAQEIEIKHLKTLDGEFLTITPDEQGTLGKYIYAVNGEDANNGTEQSASNRQWIKVIGFNAGDRFSVTTYGDALCNPVVFFKDATINHDNYYGAPTFATGNTVYNDYVFTIPNGVTMFVVNTKNASTNPIVVKKYTETKTVEYLADLTVNSFVHSPMDYIGSEISVFDKLICMGDSLTFGGFNNPPITPDQSHATRTVEDGTYSYPKMLKKMYGVESTTLGYSGATSSEWLSRFGNDSWSGHDCAIVFIGTNDNRFVNVQGMTAEQAVNTNLQNLQTIISKLQSDNYGIPIFLCTIFDGWCDVAGVTGFRDMINANIRSLCDTMSGVYCIDFNKYSDFSAQSGWSYVHPVAIGYREMAKQIASTIGLTINENREDFKWVQFVGTQYAVAIGDDV